MADQSDNQPAESGSRRTWRRYTVGVVAVLACGAATVFGVTAATGSDDPRTAATGGDDPDPAASPNATATAPSTPPARVCGNDSILDGPDEAPSKAVTVGTSDNLQRLTENNPPGTTFWLESGVHELGSGRYSQVRPKDHDVYTGAPGAVLDGRHRNLYAFAGHATDVTIKHLTIRNFGSAGDNNNQGVVNHDSASGWTIERNTIRGNAGAGVMLGSKNVLRHNCLIRNGQYGFSAYHSDGVTDLLVAHNEIARNNTDNWEERRPGCGCTGGGKFWAVTGAVVRGNWIHDNMGPGLWADTNNVGFTFERNYISHNDGEGIIYEISYNAAIRYNTFVRNGLVSGPNNPGFPVAAIYISESGSDHRVKSRHNDAFVIAHNRFVNNWSGVVLWENADRFAGSPANTSTGAGTLVNPDRVTAKTCNKKNIDDEPYYSDCRWKTKNVRVHSNTFTFDPDAIGNKCTPKLRCGFNAIMSNWGTYPSWSSYKGEVIEKDITLHQNNKFFDNTYVGPWQFIVLDQSTVIDWHTWRAEPYNQDPRSSFQSKPQTPSETGTDD